MTKQELEEKIAKGESVWCIDYIEHKRIANSYQGKEIAKIYSQIKDFEEQQDYLDRLRKICFNTKAEAEHYLRHTNITRIETLPFLTWEEFQKANKINFISANNEEIEMEFSILKGTGYGDHCIIEIWKNDDMIYEYEATEENFYKAYDECVKLFKGE